MIASLFGILSDNIMQSVYDILLWIDTKIYGFVATMFNLFIELANASSSIFKESFIRDFASKIYVIVGIIALFIVSYNLLLAVVNPDKLQKNMSNLVMKFVASLIIIVLIPSIFSFANHVQNVIINDGIIAKLFLGGKGSDINVNVEGEDDDGKIVNETLTLAVDSKEVVKQYGAELTWTVFNAFFYIDIKAPDVDKADSPDKFTTDHSPVGVHLTLIEGIKWYSCGAALFSLVANVATKFIPAGGVDDAAAAGLAVVAKPAAVKCASAVATTIGKNAMYTLTEDKISWGATRIFAANGDFGFITGWSDEIVDGNVVYTPIISTICGLMLIYLIFSFSLDLGVRAIKLAFYQLIAPIPIFLRLLPNQDKVFSNWIKVSVTTYMEIFIRLIVIYTMCFFASEIGNVNIRGFSILGKAIVVLGLVTFAKQLPKILSDITGIDSGNMKIGIMEKLGAGGALAAGALLGGAVVGGLRSGVNNWKNTRGNSFGKRLGSTAKSSIGGAMSSGYRGAKNAGFKAKSFGDTWSAIKTGSKEAYDKSESKRKYKANHPGFGGVVRGKAGDLWNELIYSDELKQYNDRIKLAQEFDIQKKVNEWVTSNDAATKEAEAVLKSFESKKLNDSEIVEKERKRLEGLINDKSISKALKAKYEERLNKLNRNDSELISTLKNGYIISFNRQLKELKAKRDEIRSSAIKRYAASTGSEIQQMIIDANKIRNNNSNDELFRSTRNIDFATVVDDLKTNHESIVGKDIVPRDDLGNVIYTDVSHTPGTIEQMRSSDEYKKAFERYKEKVEKEGKN